jgi:RND family efflux transporter MFP subunit
LSDLKYSPAHGTEAVSDNTAKPDNVRVLKKRKKGVGKKIAVGVLLILLAGAAALYVLPRNSAPVPSGPFVDTGQIKIMDVEDKVIINGMIEGRESARVMSVSEFEISEILVSVGDTVTKGQTLARLNVSSLEDQQSKARTALDSSKYRYDAMKKLYEEGAVSEQDMKQAETAYNSDLITVNSFDIGSKSRIESPISGTVTRVNANIGSKTGNMAAGEALFVIEDLSHLKMTVRVNEYDIRKIKINQNVTISSEVLGNGDAHGFVSNIAPTGEKKDAGSSEMVVPVNIEITEGNGIIAGVTGKASILIQRSEGALAAPLDAVLQDPTTGESTIFVVKNDNTLKAVPVTVGVEGSLYLELISDELHDGDRIVLSPSFELSDGMTVLTAPN